jgi:hypothetical protein
LCFTQYNIIDFVETHYDWLLKNNLSNLFLFDINGIYSSNNRFWFINIRLNENNQLGIQIFPTGHFSVVFGYCHSQIIVLKL